MASRPAPVTHLNDVRACLFVGDPVYLHLAQARLPSKPPVKICQIFDVPRYLLNRRHPDIVLSLAMTPLFDCMDLAELLYLHNFQNAQRIFDTNLPNPELVCREVRATFPGLDFGVLSPADLS
ncbi:hypothetical protein [Oceaniglobus trochenteri]|uniref:hypothetical protein n=1 Tax=Oceaniglobus trochenteri TaxID=2763260 RepID=UPI001CFF9239|nr:hypothetical protein [Oceaniglobus trochenteri]